ncbi:hypothetical protein CORC01_12200 [Colletotrichum orchidophilum]|uniref:Uncharacterized protein n=1 Tax=Colletotrichum orchidophilum TaxID=1209926 RepID=A0A1G4ATU8_9PEZI|nr:uncharacterized protein CORC01_12200 [Colletotrichum orchidophilum]OHE92482.1 hypothetical protein CORC01_12200 [Colletotrichum orchidophilum]
MACCSVPTKRPDTHHFLAESLKSSTCEPPTDPQTRKDFGFEACRGKQEERLLWAIYKCLRCFFDLDSVVVYGWLIARGTPLIAEATSKQFAKIHLLADGTYPWWFRYNIWCLIPEHDREGKPMLTGQDFVRECAVMSRVFCQILIGWERDQGTGWTGNTVMNYMTARLEEGDRQKTEVFEAAEQLSHLGSYSPPR